MNAVRIIVIAMAFVVTDACADRLMSDDWAAMDKNANKLSVDHDMTMNDATFLNRRILSLNSTNTFTVISSEDLLRHYKRTLEEKMLDLHLSPVDDDVDPFFLKINDQRVVSVRMKRTNNICTTEHNKKKCLPSNFIIGPMRARLSYIRSSVGRNVFEGLVPNKDHTQSYFTSNIWSLFDFSMYHPMQPTVGDASNHGVVDIANTYFEHPWVPRRIHTLVQDAKFVVVLRNPIHRAVSHIIHAFRDASADDIEKALFKQIQAIQDCRKSFSHYGESRLFGCLLSNASHLGAEAFSQSWSHFRLYNVVASGCYAEHIVRWLRYFPSDSFLFIDSDDILRNRLATWQKISQHFHYQYNLQLDNLPKFRPSSLWSFPADDPSHQQWIALLQEFYIQENKALFQLIGTEFHWQTALPRGNRPHGPMRNPDQKKKNDRRDMKEGDSADVNADGNVDNENGAVDEKREDVQGNQQQDLEVDEEGRQDKKNKKDKKDKKDKKVKKREKAKHKSKE